MRNSDIEYILLGGCWLDPPDFLRSINFIKIPSNYPTNRLGFGTIMNRFGFRLMRRKY